MDMAFLSVEAGFQQTFISDRWYRRTFQSQVPERSKNRNRSNQKAIPSIRIGGSYAECIHKALSPNSAIAVFLMCGGLVAKAHRDCPDDFIGMGTFGLQT
jgi:hypothetical protein